MIEFQGPDGLEFWPPHQVASIVPEFRNWWRGVRSDGRVAHRPTPPPPGPWVPHASGFVNSVWLTAVGSQWKDPADFLWPGGELPKSPAETESPEVPGLGVRASQVYALTKVKGKEEIVWHTDAGEVVWKWQRKKLDEAARLVPDFFLLRRCEYLNRRRLSSIRSDGGPHRIFRLDNGCEYRMKSSLMGAAQCLGLTGYLQLEPAMPERFRAVQLRDWPVDLSKASRAFLRKHFANPTLLIANIIWQRFRDRQAGIFKRCGDTYRGFWYTFLVHALYRAGFLEAEEVRREVSCAPHRGRLSRADSLFLLNYQVMDHLVDECRFFDFREVGFKDPDPKGFTLGVLRPEIVLVTEKDACLEFARKLVREFGVSHYHLGGQPSVLRSEYVAERLRRVIKSFRAIAYVDFDAGGWILGRAAAAQLERRGLQLDRFDYLLRHECFTEEEKRLHSHPCKMGSAAAKTKVRLWMESGGGLDGQPRGIYASYVEPYSRVRELFVNLL